MHNGDVYEASIKDIDKKSDIATIKINPQVSQRSTDHCSGDDGLCSQTSSRWCLALFTRFGLCFSSFLSRKLILTLLLTLISTRGYVLGHFCTRYDFNDTPFKMPLSSPDEGVCWDCGLLRGFSE